MPRTPPHRARRPDRSALIGCLAAALFFTASTTAQTGDSGTSTTPSARHRGVSWVAGGEVAAGDFEPLVRNGVNWIVQTPFGWQRGHKTPSVRLVTSGRVLWGETDEGLRRTTELARQNGIRTLLKPHIWLSRSGGRWRSDIAMDNEADWQAWFASYATFILHYARVAEEVGIEALAVGTELHETVKQRPEDWRRLIQEIRAVYSGQLTYAANWWEEFEDVPFWAELDFIGIQAYFPLSQDDRPSVESLRRGWREPLEKIRRIQARFDKPVLFTEIGYRSMEDAAVEPWKWVDRLGALWTGADQETQENCYEAFFQVVWSEPWFAGVYFWKWFPRHDESGGEGDPNFTPQNKAAEKVLGRYFRASTR